MSNVSNTTTVTSKLPGGDPFATRTATGATTDSLANRETFLQLLVAQIKHQDPLNPSDGVEFLTQLAQFTELEQTLAMRTDLSAIRADLEKSGTSADSSGSSTGTTTTGS
jgi:flagellar basal-body rod modification protein FlgD